MTNQWGMKIPPHQQEDLEVLQGSEGSISALQGPQRSEITILQHLFGMNPMAPLTIWSINMDGQIIRKMEYMCQVCGERCECEGLGDFLIIKMRSIAAADEVRGELWGKG